MDTQMTTATLFRGYALNLLALGVLTLLAGTPALANLPANPTDRFLTVDCLLPGAVKRLGMNVVFQEPRRPVKTSIEDCETRGGEYVLFERGGGGAALQYWLPQAQNGDKQAQTTVGEMFERGIGGTPDYAAALLWYRRAADQGYTRALINLGHLHEKGLGVPKDPLAALNFYRRAAGIDGAIVYDSGSGGSRDEELGKLRQELEETRRQLERARRDLEQQRSNSDREIQNLRRQQSDASSKGNTVEAQRHGARIRELEAQIAQQRAQVTSLESTANRYRTEIQSLETETGELRQQVGSLQKEVAGGASRDQELARLRKELADSRTQLERARQEMDAQRRTAEAEIQRARAQQSDATARGQTAEAQRYEARVRQLEGQLTQQRQLVSSLEQTSIGYRDQIQSLEREVAQGAARDKELARLQKELGDTRGQLERAQRELEGQRVASEAEIRRLRQQQTDAASKGQAAEAQRHEARIRQLEGQLTAQRQQVASLEQSANRYRDQIGKLETETGQLRQQVSTLERDLAAATQKQAVAQKELDERRRKAADDEKRLEEMRADVSRQKQQTSNSFSERNRLAQLELTLKQREEELQRQNREIARVEGEARQYREQVAKLEAEQKKAAAAPVQAPIRPVVMTSPGGVPLPPPTIQLLDPPLVVMRSPVTIKVRGGLPNRDITGKVTAPAGLLQFTVNDRPEVADVNGMFKSSVRLNAGITPVTIVAVDRQGKQAILEFMLVPDNAPPLIQQALEKAPLGNPDKPRQLGVDFGRFHALVIGNSKYQKLQPLDTSVNDAVAISEVLEKRYSFKVTLLKDATRADILRALNDLRKRLTDKDNLLIYYAGHGELDKVNSRGHWLPVDAEPDSDVNWISSVALTDTLNAMEAKKVLIVADSCYSGILTRSSLGQLETGKSEEARVAWLKDLSKQRSRTALTSGDLQPVADGGGGKHSVFAKSLLAVLNGAAEPIEASKVFNELSARVLVDAQRLGITQRPTYAPMRFAGHEAGDFVFVPIN